MLAFTRVRFLLLWMSLSGIAMAVCSLIWPAAHFGNELLPVGNDSFYHARRILDVVSSGQLPRQFDAHIHAPDGSLLTWPWGYDYVMGMLVRLGLQIGLTHEPLRILIWIPVASILVSMAFVLLITKKLSLSIWTSSLVGLCVALSPLTQYLHGVGFIDHHFAEYIFILASIALGMGWLTNPNRVANAIILGIAFGIAPAFHNGLFVLQVPILLTVGIRWIQRIQLPQRPVIAFCASLVGCTLAVSLPSLPLQMGLFDYYYLSWFHIYVACSTSLVIVYFSRFHATKRAIAAAAGIGLVLISPLGYQVNMAKAFLTGGLMRLDGISEMFSVVKLAAVYGPSDISSRYSLFIWLTPATMLLCIFRAWLNRTQASLLFWVSSFCGLLLLLLQFRLHYFGSLALYLPWLIFLDNIASRITNHKNKRVIMLLGSVLCILMYAPPLRSQLLGPMMVANDIYFSNLRPLLTTLHEACEEKPGIVLADNDAGHYIRYYTDCPVIANNFLLTARDEEKIQLMDRLFSMPAARLIDEAPDVRYVLVRPAMVSSDEEGNLTYQSYSPVRSELLADLLLKPTSLEAQQPPEQYVLLGQVELVDTKIKIPYARLYRIDRTIEENSRH